MTNDYDSSVRRMLVDTVAATKLVTAPARRRSLLIGALAFVLSGAVTGGAVSAIASSDLVDGEPYIIGTPPTGIGAVDYDRFGTTLLREGTGDETLELGARPDAATAVLVEFQCTSPGTFTWEPVGFESDGHTALTCRAADFARGPQRGAATATFELAPGDHQFAISATGDATWTIGLTWVRPRPVEWKTNDRGQTYGRPDLNGDEPDLVSLSGSNAEGRSVDGYAVAVDVDAALDQWNADDSYSANIPIYASDGETVVGAILIGASD